MNESVYVRYTIQCTYAKEISLEVLERRGAPVGDLDALVDWLEDNPEEAELGVLYPSEWVDTDARSVSISDAEFVAGVVS